jgi:hypothetical protein
MTIRCLLALCIVLISFGCKENVMDPLGAINRRLQSVSQEAWDSLARKKIYFGHQSVGYNIVDGLKRVLESKPSIGLRILETVNPKDFQGPIFAHSPIGQNKDPKGKIDDFRRLLEGGLGQEADIAFFKLCFVDVDQATDVEVLIEYFDTTLAELGEKFPKLVIIPVTVPLTNTAPGIKERIKRLLGRGPAVKADNIKRNFFNAHIRKKYGTAIWDLADAEATTGEGTKVEFQDNQGTYFLLNPAYTSDGGHLNSTGSQAVAIDLLIRLVSLDSH